MRLRNGEVLFEDEDEDECTDYVDANDYDPERVTVRQLKLDEDEARELSYLRDFMNEASDLVGSPWEAYEADYFTGEWAAGQDAAEDLPAWIADNVRWEEAAKDKRDLSYRYIELNGYDFYVI